MGNLNQILPELLQINGAMAVALVDLKSGMALGTAGGGINLEVATAGNFEVVRYLFICLVLNCAQSNLAMARHKLSDGEGRLEV